MPPLGPEPLPPGAVAQGTLGPPHGAVPPAPLPLATSPAAMEARAPEKKGDSPRSVILKLTGAWNALATKRHDLPGEPGADFEEMRAMCVPPAR